jgi:DNA polymerase-1
VNFQNIPRSDKVVKQAFIPKQECLVYFDYKQIEPRLMAYYLNAIGFPRLAEWIRTGVDPYTAIGRGYFGKEVLTDEERQKGKQTFLSLSYGGGLPAIRRYFVDLDWEGAKQVKNSFYRAWPEMQLLQNMLLSTIKHRTTVDEPGYITTLFGRHLHPESDHKVINALIQGCAADLMRSALVKTYYGLQKEGLRAHLVNNVHDEIQLDAPLDELPQLAELMPRWMDYEVVSKVVPIEAEMEYTTTNWAEKVAYERI